MFENLKYSFRNILNVKDEIYLGTDKEFENQVVIPLINGTKKNTFQNSDVDGIISAMTCVKVLGDTISRIPIKIFNYSDSSGPQIDKSDYRYDLLNYSPDNIITAQSFFSTLEVNRNLRGNSFARIRRNRASGRVTSLELIPTNRVGGYKIVRGQLYYMIYKKDSEGKKKEETVNSNDVLHFRMFSKNGIWGFNPIEIQRLNMSTLWKAKQTVDNFYENNAFSPKVLQSKIPDVQFQEVFAEAMREWKNNNVGPANAGEVIKLPPFTEIQELSLDPVDAKFIESMKFDTTQIAAFYGVPPDMVGVYEFSKYNNVEQKQQEFIVNTIAAITRMYRQELEMKLLTTKERKSGKSIEFQTQALIETDIKTRSQYFKTMQNLGVATPNQIAKLEGFPTFEEGDKHYMSSQTLPIEDRDTNDASLNE